MRYQDVKFLNQNGDSLSAILEFPITGKPSAYAIFAHCFACGKNHATTTNISHQLASANIATIRFDSPGFGDSTGNFNESSFSSNVNDLVSAAQYLEKNFVSPEILIGHSLGGTAAILASERISSIKALITIGAPADIENVNKLLVEKDGDNKESELIKVGDTPFSVKNEFLKDLSKYNPGKVLSKSRKAILIMHSPQDRVVDIKNATTIYEHAFHPKSFISLDHINHMLSSKEDAVYAGRVMASWLSKYLDLEKRATLKTEKQAVVRTGKEKFFTDIKTGNHYLVADEPLHMHGQDLGPSPYDLLVSALGACTNITLHMYANHKGWDLEEVFTHVKHWKEHVEDSQTPTGKIDKISRQIEIIGNLDETQRKRLLQIANKCPVHKILEGKVHIDTEEIAIT